MNEEGTSQQLGKYEILGQIGRGGFATVYRALDTTLGREVALKILHPQLLTDTAFVGRFQHEARTLAGLRHPHIVTIYEVGEVEGQLFIAMELAQGSSLAQAIAERGHLPWQETLALLRPVCQALDYAHRRGVVHRDLKPANILLDEERGPLLTDFGFARLMAESSASLSLSGGILGTPAYIAPEVWELSAAEAPVDIYALGCIVCEVLTGEVLFAGQSPMEVMRAHDRGPRFPAQWPKGIPGGVEPPLKKALARDRADRFESAGAFAAELEGLAVEIEDPLAGPYQSLKDAVAAGEWAHASRLARGILVRERNYRDVPALARRATEAMRRSAPEAPAGEPKGPGAPVGRPLKWWWFRLLALVSARRSIVLAGWGLLGMIAVLVAILALKPLAGPGISWLAFVSDRDGNAEIYNLDRNGRATRLTQDPGRDADPAWSPDKRRIVFCSDRDGDWEIYWVNADGTKSGQVTDHPARDTQPAWHPNGSYIAFTSDRDGKREIYDVGADGIRRITSSPGDSESWDPAWAPDSTLLFTSDRGGKREVHRITPSGEVMRVTHTPGDGESWSPAWARGGGYVAFVSDRDGGTEVYAVAGDGSVSRVTQTPGGHVSWGPTVDPTRGDIAFASNRNGSLEVFNISNGDAVQLTHTPGDGRSWSPAW